MNKRLQIFVLNNVLLNGWNSCPGRNGTKFLPCEMVTLGPLLKQFGFGDCFWTVIADCSDINAQLPGQGFGGEHLAVLPEC